jgi:hypothetical protein
MWAAMGGHTGIIRELFARGCDPCQTNKEGLNALMTAAMSGRFDAFSVVGHAMRATLGPIPSTPSTRAESSSSSGTATAATTSSIEGKDTIDSTCNAGGAAIMKRWRELLDARTQYGDTVLHQAASKGNQSIVQQLLEWRANPAATNQRHQTPIDAAVDHPECVAILKQALATATTSAKKSAKQLEKTAHNEPKKATTSAKQRKAAAARSKKQATASTKSNVSNGGNDDNDNDVAEEVVEDSDDDNKNIKNNNGLWPEPSAAPVPTSSSTSSSPKLAPKSTQRSGNSKVTEGAVAVTNNVDDHNGEWTTVPKRGAKPAKVTTSKSTSTPQSIPILTSTTTTPSTTTTAPTVASGSGSRAWASPKLGVTGSAPSTISSSPSISSTTSMSTSSIPSQSSSTITSTKGRFVLAGTHPLSAASTAGIPTLIPLDQFNKQQASGVAKPGALVQPKAAGSIAAAPTPTSSTPTTSGSLLSLLKETKTAGAPSVVTIHSDDHVGMSSLTSNDGAVPLMRASSSSPSPVDNERSLESLVDSLHGRATALAIEPRHVLGTN